VSRQVYEVGDDWATTYTASRGEQAPAHGVLQADFAVKVERLVAVVPRDRADGLSVARVATYSTTVQMSMPNTKLGPTG